MPRARYDGLVTVQVTREYIIRLEVEADDVLDATDKLKWHALGMSGKQIATLAESADPESTYEGEERTVTDIYSVEQMPPPKDDPE